MLWRGILPAAPWFLKWISTGKASHLVPAHIRPSDFLFPDELWLHIGCERLPVNFPLIVNRPWSCTCPKSTYVIPLVFLNISPQTTSISKRWQGERSKCRFLGLPQTYWIQSSGKGPKIPPFYQAPEITTKAGESPIQGFTSYPSSNLDPGKRTFALYQQSLLQKWSHCRFLKLCPLSLRMADSRAVQRVCVSVFRATEVNILLTLESFVFCTRSPCHSFVISYSFRGKKIDLLMDLSASCCQKMKKYITPCFFCSFSNWKSWSNFLAQVWQSVQLCGLNIFTLLPLGGWTLVLFYI